MARGIGPADVDVDVDVGDAGGTSGSGGPRTLIRPIGVSPAISKQLPEAWFRGNKWPPTDQNFTFQNTSTTKQSSATRGFPRPPWTAFYYSIAVIGELVQVPATATLAGIVWNTIDLAPILAAANVAAELVELAELIEYRPAVMAEASAQLDAPGVIDYFRGVLNFTPSSHPYTHGLARVGIRIGEFQVMHYKARFNRPRPSTLSPALMPPIEVPGHAAFPSGHATQSHLTALCLAAVMPAAANQAVDSNNAVILDPVTGLPDPAVGPLQRVAERISRNREVLGLHYPSDSAAGKLLAEQTFLLLKECQTVKDIIALAAAEWA
jgi:membrane-associated phospholipid phosphatase